MAGASTQTEPPAASPSSSKLSTIKTNAAYLALGTKASQAPASLATRSALTTTRYVLKYVIRRLLRYAKYAAIGGVVAVLGGTMLGTLGSGIAFFAAPSLGVGMGIGVITAMAKFGWRHRGNHFRGGVFEMMEKRAQEGRDGGADEAMDSKQRGEEVKKASHKIEHALSELSS